mmetsp:Transcript_73933/g.190799  ORF Transcript_73933/g.190799 Transcript_73933/m.190799 type:complete len:139 (+) Transcript_73933:84-500(+)
MEAVESFQKKVEELQGRVQVQTLPVEKKMAQGILDCYNARGADYASIHRCVEGCQQKMQTVGQKVQSEFGALQGSVQACQQSCIKRLEPRFEAARTDEAAQKALTKEYEQGVARCVKDAEPTLPEMESRIKQILKEAS